MMEREFHFEVAAETAPESDNVDKINTHETFTFDAPTIAENGLEERVLKVRLDKWLWAARFFKTRALARLAVENRKVFYNGKPVKPSLEIEVGAELKISMGRTERTVLIQGLSTRRHATNKAEELYIETEESKNSRESQEPNWNSHNTPYNSATIYPAQSQDTRSHKPVRFLRRPILRYEHETSFNSVFFQDDKTKTLDLQEE